ncbi:MAG TPA: 50S ribosomal protein L21 [bacterium]|nr:50S ribosomal protein L21 [bacterium]
MYALIETGGQQFKVQEGQTIKVERIEGEVGAQIELDKVLLVRTDSDVKVGAPYLNGAKVLGEIVAQDRNKKVIVFKYKRRKDYHKKVGHRQPYTALKITKITS